MCSLGRTPGSPSTVPSIDYYRDRDPQISQLTIEDLRESRLYLVDPAPIPADELQRTYDWMKSWDFLETAPCATNLVSMNVRRAATSERPERLPRIDGSNPVFTFDVQRIG
jgi:hypothetical protein